MLEKGYLGGGNTARNTTIIRSNYLTPEGVKFYDASLALWAGLASEFDFNLFYSTRGHFTLAHSDADLRTARWRAEVNKHFGVRSEVVDAAFVLSKDGTKYEGKLNSAPTSTSPKVARPVHRSHSCSVRRTSWR